MPAVCVLINYRTLESMELTTIYPYTQSIIVSRLLKDQTEQQLNADAARPRDILPIRAVISNDAS